MAGLCGGVVVMRGRGVGSSMTFVINLRFWMINIVGGIFGLDGILLLGEGFMMATMLVKTL